LCRFILFTDHITQLKKLSQEHKVSKLHQNPTRKLLTKTPRHRELMAEFLQNLQCSIQAPSSNTSEKKNTIRQTIGDFGAGSSQRAVRPQNDHFDSGAFG
jgi:hypothetical protein